MAQFYQLAGTQLSLPDYARIDLAFTSSVTAPKPAAGLEYTYAIAGQYIEIPMIVVFSFTTSGTVAARIPYVRVTDGGSGIILLAPPPALQTATTFIDYVYTVGSAYAFGPVGAIATMGMPAVALLPSCLLQIQIGSLQAGDQLSNITVTTVKIPTGPALVLPSVTAVTPVLV
jgi:hypothetical protein